MNVFELNNVIEREDKKKIKSIYYLCKESVPKTILDIFVNITRQKKITLDDLNRIVLYSFNNNINEMALYNLAKRVYVSVYLNYGEVWYTRETRGSCIDDYMYCDKVRLPDGFHDISIRRTDGKKQVARIVGGVNENPHVNGYMTQKRAKSILECYYGLDMINDVVKIKGKPYFQVHFFDGKIIRMSKHELEDMARVNG